MTDDLPMPIVPETPTTACVEADSPRTMRSGHSVSERLTRAVHSNSGHQLCHRAQAPSLLRCRTPPVAGAGGSRPRATSARSDSQPPSTLHSESDLVAGHAPFAAPQEKIGFGVAEHMLAAVGRALTGRLVAHGGEIVEAQATGAVAKARKLLAAARRRLTRGKVRAARAEVVAAPHALLLPAQWCLFSVHLLLPLLGAYLLLHMARHGWQRAGREWREQRSC